MVGDSCSPAWLHDHLSSTACIAAETAAGSTAAERLLILDCRPPADYRASHVLGSLHLAGESGVESDMGGVESDTGLGGK